MTSDHESSVQEASCSLLLPDFVIISCIPMWTDSHSFKET
jgi:hypothetical protein